ncbi:oligoribonuclease [Coxiella endosymbiont of Amblyomma nuttalli]|uniref:oligoribonuclease n=1 Tax=Coxiella endosymbiont of Amblyomma nuttalli TaxID=2749996 RepID=UPI001BA93CAE|nr:oligoribonuclease [Coxiella endosymbiont of Amblyomma nuttalli]QTS83907.1 Oligoribonuclease [Coxiella endosymbiont of Amblyomma nuttalli]
MTAVSVSEDNLIWLDLEMTGLDPNRDRILEIATIVTSSNLNILAEGPSLAIHQSNEVLEAMDDWNTCNHTTSGLIKRVKTIGITERKAEIETLDFLKNYVPKGKSPLCGNSVCQDRRFLHRHMPTLDQFFHYRHLDVSTLKILAQRWAPEIMRGLIKELQHLALQDIRDSIEELRYYRTHLLK